MLLIVTYISNLFDIKRKLVASKNKPGMVILVEVLKHIN